MVCWGEGLGLGGCCVCALGVCILLGVIGWGDQFWVGLGCCDVASRWFTWWRFRSDLLVEDGWVGYVA